MQQEFDLSLLRTFVAIVETGGLTSAGRSVGRTQPAISHQVKRLEDAVGHPLFGSDKRNLTLTREGELLLEYARTMLQLNDEAHARFAGPEIEGRVILGTPDLYAAYLLPGILRSFSMAYAGVEIELRCQRSNFLLSALKTEEIDLAIITQQHDHRAGQLVRREPLVWVASTAARPEEEPVLPLALLSPESLYRTRVLEALGREKRRWSIVSTSDSSAGLQAAVYAGLAVTALPKCAVSPAMRPLGAAEGMPNLAMLDLVMVPKRKKLSAAAEHLSEYISQRLESVQPFQAHETSSSGGADRSVRSAKSRTSKQRSPEAG